MKREITPRISRPSVELPGLDLSHVWQGLTLEVRLTGDAKQRQLEITPRESGGHNEHQTSPNVVRLWRASEIALENDAALARLIQQGEKATVVVNPPRQRQAGRIETVDDVFERRPSVEELISPLLYETEGRELLRQFQESGAAWLAERNKGILADDMGLGKTAQSLRALEALIDNGSIQSALIVCPKSLMANWEAECERWIPRLTVVRVTPPKDESDRVWSAILGRSHVLITSYEQLRPLPPPIAAERLDLLIVDEAHRLRRNQARLVKAFRGITATRMWALTGTPIERAPEDLATLLSLLEPSRFSAKSASLGAGLRATAEPYILRRLKSDVLRELPDVIDTKETVELSASQRLAYTKARSRPLPKDVGEALQRLTILRNICDAEPKDGSSAKLDRILEILQTVRDAGEKAVVFSYVLRPLDLLLERMHHLRPSLEALTLTGQQSLSERNRTIQRFKSDDNVVALLCSSRVGSEGLTLTEANHVIFINEWWNPSANAQARDRVVRLGQQRIVQVRRFRCKETVEEALDQILDKKSETFANIVDALAADVNVTDPESKSLLAKAVEQMASEP